MKRFAVISGLVACGLLSGLAISACGGSSPAEKPIVVSDTTRGLSKDAFIAQADGICQQANTQIAAIAAAGGGITQAAQIASLRQGEVTQIRALGTPTNTGPTNTGTSTGPSPGGPSSSGTANNPTGQPTTPNTSTFPASPSTGKKKRGRSTGAGATGAAGASATGTTGVGTGTGAARVTGDPLETFLTELSAEATAGEKIDLASKRHEATAAGEAELSAAKAKAAVAASQFGFLQCGTEATSGTATTGGGTSTGAGGSAPSTSSGTSHSKGGQSSGKVGSSGGGVSAGGGGVGPGK